MAINLSDNILAKTTAPGDAKYGPYLGSSISVALSAAKTYLLSSYRYKGLTIGIIVNSEPIVEYWFYSGVNDVDLIIKDAVVNLTTSQTASNFTINSDTGSDAIVPLGNGTLAGGTLNDYTTAEKALVATIPNINTNAVDRITVKLGEAITKGQAVYVSSASGTNIIVSKASNTTEALSSKTLGLLETTGALNDIVNVVTGGLLEGLNTSTATIGDPVWLGVNGDLIYGLANKPYAPEHLVSIGIVSRVSATVGEIIVRVQNGFELKEIHDVAVQTPSHNDGLFYETSSSLWKNKSIETILGYAPANANGISNYLSKFTGGSALGNSTIQDTGSLVTINNSLYVDGLQTFRGTVASDRAPFGPNLTTTGSGTNWAGTSFTNGYTHTPGSTAPLVSTLSAVVGLSYLIQISVEGLTAGSIIVSFGGTSRTITTNISTLLLGRTTTTTAVLTVTPTTDFNGLVGVAISIVGNSSATTQFMNASGVSANEIRASDQVTNTFAGVNAGSKHIVSVQCSAFGNSALQNNIAGIANAAFGYRALNVNGDGVQNSAFGTSALLSNNGDNNTAVGYIALGGNTTGNQNTAVGAFALRNSTTSSGNTAVGYNTLTADTTGSANTAIGSGALSTNTTGSNNIAIGLGALNGSTTSGGHIAIGNGALGASANVSSTNVGIGYLAFSALSSGTNNVAIGVNVARELTGGVTNLTAATSSIFIGNSVKAQLNSQSNQIVIGNIAEGLGTNTTVLGNSSTVTTAIWGDLILGTTSKNTSAILQADSTSKGFLPPRMTNGQRAAITTPAVGLMVYCTDAVEGVYVNKSTGWTFIG